MTAPLTESQIGKLDAAAALIRTARAQLMRDRRSTGRADAYLDAIATARRTGIHPEPAIGFAEMFDDLWGDFTGRNFGRRA